IGIGWFNRWASGANFIYLMVGIWKEHGKYGLFLNWTNAPGLGHGIEYSIVMGSMLLFLVLAGAGDYSIDGRRQRYSASRAAGRARLRRAEGRSTIQVIDLKDRVVVLTGAKRIGAVVAAAAAARGAHVALAYNRSADEAEAAA